MGGPVTSDPGGAISQGLDPPLHCGWDPAQRGPRGFPPCGSCHVAYLVHLVQPVLVGGQLGHERLVLLPLGVQVAGLVVGHVLGRQHLLVDPEFQLERAESGDGERPSALPMEARVRHEVGGGELGAVGGVGRSREGVVCTGGGGHCGGLILGSESQGAVGTGRQGIVGGHKGEPRLTS